MRKPAAADGRGQELERDERMRSAEPAAAAAAAAGAKS